MGMILEFIRIVFGFAFVMLLPGLALTSALWPKTKRRVYGEVLKVLDEKGASESAIAGRPEDVEEIAEFLGEQSIKINDNSQVMILAGEMEGQEQEINTEGRTIIDLGNNVEDAIKVDDTIDGIERLTLSVGLSIAIVPLIGLILNFTPFGIRFESVFVSLSLVIILLFAVYYMRTKTWNTSKSLS